MNLKKTWNKKYGKSEIVTKENSPCKNVEIDMVKLTKGDKKAIVKLTKSMVCLF